MELVAIPREVIDQAVEVLMRHGQSQSAVVAGWLTGHAASGQGIRVDDTTMAEMKLIHQMVTELFSPTNQVAFDPRFCDVFLRPALQRFREYLVREVRNESHK